MAIIVRRDEPCKNHDWVESTPRRSGRNWIKQWRCRRCNSFTCDQRKLGSGKIKP